MKKMTKLVGIIVLVAVIGFTMTACGGGGGGGDSNNNSNTITVANTSGRLTITEIPTNFNNKWVLATDRSGPYVAFENATSRNNIVAAKVSNGSATLKVWRYDGNSLYNYSGNDTITFRITFVDRASVSEYELLNTQSGTSPIIDRAPDEAILFSNGIGSCSGAMWQ